MSIGKIRNLGVGGGTVKPLYLVKDGKAQVGVIDASNIITITDMTGGQGDFSRIHPSVSYAGVGRFAIALDGNKYRNVHIKYSTTDYRATLNSIGVSTDETTVPSHLSYQTISTETWALTPNVDNYITFRVYVSDATAVIDIYELYVE